MLGMRRREFISLLGGAVAAWPLPARAQQRERMRRVGVFTPGAADDPEHQARNAAFLQGLGELGWIVGRNVRIEYRWGAGDYERFRAMAAELVALAPDVILAQGSSTVTALQKTSSTVPIVFANVTDPVGSSLVASLARPGVTPLDLLRPNSASVESGWELLKELAPRVTRVAVLRSSAVARVVAGQLSHDHAAPPGWRNRCATSGMQVLVLRVRQFGVDVRQRSRGPVFFLRAFGVDARR
jgi:putative tryptophan/tyrosine transport system substrate-binding protein